jgi:replicative DNA helicase
VLNHSTLPHDHDLEREVLSAVFVDPECLWLIRELLAPADFHSHANGRILGHMIAVQDRDGRVDLPLLTTQLRASNDGALQPQMLSLLDRAGTTSQLERYAGRVAEYAVLRRMADAADRVAHEACMPDAAEDVAAWTAESLRAVEDAAQGGAVDTLVLAHQAMPGAWLDMQEAKSQERTYGLNTGIRDLDEWTDGLPRKLCVIAARAKMGKTALAMSISAHWLHRGMRVLWLQQEMDEREFWARYLAQSSRVPFRAIAGRERLGESQGRDVAHASQRIADWRLAVDFRTRMTAEGVKLAALKARRVLGGLDAIVVDHFHCMQHGSVGDDPRHGMEATSNYLRDTAKDLGVCMLLLAQLNRGSDKRANQRPVLSDIRECGALEQDAHIIFAPHRPYYYDRTADKRHAELLVLGNRNGDTGPITMRFIPEIMHFHPVM